MNCLINIYQTPNTKIDTHFKMTIQNSSFTLILLGLASLNYSVSVDCSSLIIFANGLGVESNQPVIWNELQSDCCIAEGIACLNQRVTHIDWKMRRLNGTLNGTSIPTTLIVLILSDNQVSGTIPILPDGLIYIEFNTNRLNGTIPVVLPSQLTSFHAHSNQFTGRIPEILPMRLKKLDLSHNHLFGNISSCPNELQMLHLHDNNLSGDLPAFPYSLVDLWLGYRGDQSRNLFTGTLILHAPIDLYINDNRISDVRIQNTSLLINCDLSNNPLLGNPGISNLTMCTKTGLYGLLTTSTTFEIVEVDKTSSLNFASISFLVTSASTGLTLSVDTTGTVVTDIEYKYSETNILNSLSVSTRSIIRVDNTTIGTIVSDIQFNQIDSLNNLTLYQYLKMSARLFLNIILLGIVLRKTPWKREWQKLIKTKISVKEFDSPSH